MIISPYYKRAIKRLRFERAMKKQGFVKTGRYGSYFWVKKCSQD